MTTGLAGTAILKARWWRVGALALLVLMGATGCAGPKIPAGNLKELKEKKRELKEAQRKAEDGAAAPDAAAGNPPTAAAAPPASGADQDGLAAGTARVTLRAADGSTRKLILRQPLVGRWERVFLSTGGVRDRDRLGAEFVFRKGLGKTSLKFKKVARVEWVGAEAGTRTGVRLRFHFRRVNRPAEEFAGEDLLGADHPVAPFLLGIDPRGVEVRLPLFPPLDTVGYESIVEVEFG